MTTLIPSSPQLGQAFVDGVTVGERLRSLQPEKVDALAQSMEVIGLQFPIHVYAPNDETCELVAGLHRLEAARKLGWEEIDCFFLDADDITRELWEIDENLIRAELTPAQEAKHLERRKELWKLRKTAEQSGTICSTLPETGRGNEQFAADTAKATGQSKQDINRKVSRAKKIAPDVLGALTGTDMDLGVELDAIRNLTHDEQRQALQRVKSGASKNLREARDFIRGDTDKTTSNEGQAGWTPEDIKEAAREVRREQEQREIRALAEEREKKGDHTPFNRFLKEKGRYPGPKEAQEIAAASPRGTAVPATDGHFHGPDPEADARGVEEMMKRSALMDAFEALADAPYTPEQAVGEFRYFEWPQINEHLPLARRWIERFDDERKRHDKDGQGEAA